MSEANTSTENGSHTGNPLPNQKQSQQQQEKKNKPASPSVEGTSTEAKANADLSTHSNEGATNSVNNTPPTSTSGSALPGNSSNPSSPRTSRSKRNNAAFPPRGGATPKSPSMRGSDNETKPSVETASPGSPSVAKTPTAQKDNSDTGSQLNPETVGTVGLGVVSGNDTKTEQSSHQSPQPSRRGGFGKPNGDRPANSLKGGYGNRGESRGGGDDENSRGRRSDRRMNRSDTTTATPTDSPTPTSANASKPEGDSNPPSPNSNATTSTSGDAKSHQQSESPGVADVKKTHNATRSPRSPRSPRRGFGERGVDAKNGSPAKGASPSPRPKKDNVSVESGSHKNEPTNSGAPATATTPTPSTPSTPSTEPLKKRKPTKKNKKKDDDDVSTVSAGSARDVSTEDKESSRNVRPNDNEAATESQEGVNEGSSATWARKSKPNRNTQQQQRSHGSADGSNPRSAHKSPSGSYHTFDPNSPRNKKDDASYSNKGNHRSQNSNRNNNNSAESHRPQQGNSSSTETTSESKNWESDEKKPDTQAQSGWGDPPTETTGDGWGETSNLGLKWGEEPPKTSGGGGGWDEPAASPSLSWNEKPAKYNGGKGRGEDPSKSSGGRWGENPAKASGGGRGRGRGEEPTKTSGGGWDEKPAKTNGGGWGEKPTKTSGGKWNEKSAKTSGGGWGEKPTETSSSGGWGEKPAETSSGGWGEKPAETGGSGGWSEKATETSGGGGWGEKPAETSGGGWGEKPAETGGSGGWGEKPAEASGEGWGKPAETSGGGWGEPPAAPSLKWGQEIPWDTQNSLKPLSDPDWGKGDSGGDNNPSSGGNNGNSNRRLEGNQPRMGGGRGRPMGDSDSRFSNSHQGYQRGGKRPQGPDNHFPRDARSSLDARNARLGVQRGPRPGAAKAFSDSASVSSSDVPESTTAVQEPASADTVESRPAKKGTGRSDGASERRETPFQSRRQPTSSTGPSDVRLDPRYNNRQNGPRPGQRGGAFSSQYRQDNHSSSSVSSDVYQNGPPAKGKFDQAAQLRKNPKDKVPERYTPLCSDSLECQMTWKDMDLSPSVLACIAKAGLDKPSNVQKLIMKPFQEGRDVIAQAQSQNDRTNTLAIALLQKLSSSASTQKRCQALVICSEGINPQKVHEDFENWFSSTPGLRSILLNADVVAEKTLLLDPEQPKQVILTTLGPLMEAINNNLLDMKAIGTVAISMRSAELVNFEAFKKFWANLSRDAQVVLMTGRIMPQIQMIKTQNFRTNAAVRRADELTMQWSEHYYISVPLPEQQAQLESGHGDDAKKDSESAPKDRKWEILMDILTKNPDISHSVILTQSQSVTQALTAKLEAQKLPVLSVWSMADKTEVARQFNRPEPCILVSESVLMDSLDLDYSSLMINYEMPRKASHYISSFGPFGRSGLRTLVINFCATEDAVQKQTLGDMESIYDIKIQEMQDLRKPSFSL